jgi:23S rRNA maturation-related 3'-5' exoribonuclease YhaM
MNNSRKTAYQRFKQLKQQKIGNTTITTPNVKPNTLKPRRRTDEIYQEMEERLYEEIESKMLDLSKWSGEGSLFKYRDLVI